MIEQVILESRQEEKITRREMIGIISAGIGNILLVAGHYLQEKTKPMQSAIQVKLK
jgi:hypothetical protein